MRAFLGIPVSPASGETLIETYSVLARINGAKPVEQDNLHVTVKFLDEISQEQRWQVDNGLQKLLPPVGPLELEITGFGAFPDLSYPRVVWAGVSPQKPLTEVNAAAEQVGKNIGVEPAEHDYHPHITLCRFNNPDSRAEQIVSWIKEASPAGIPGFSAPRLVLYESQLEESGPVYNQLESWPL